MLLLIQINLIVIQTIMVQYQGNLYLVGNLIITSLDTP